jgi:hypothetical protein
MTHAAEADWFNLRTVDFDRLDELENCLDAFARRELDGLIIRQVYPAAAMREVGARVSRHEPPFYIFPPLASAEEARKYRHLYGITLVAARSLTEYFRVAKSFRLDCRELFRDHADYEARVSHIFSVLSGGRAVTTPLNADGEIYMPATIRVLPPGAGIELHCDNNLSHHPTYAHLKTVCDVANQLAYFLTIDAPDEGGELVVYRRRWEAEDDAPSEYVMSKSELMVEDRESRALKPRPGDMILFAGGRIYHRVTDSGGARARQTIGGFVAHALDGGALHYWS